jgi:hypothetical protein
MEVAGALVPVSQARQLMAAYGYDRIQLDLAARLEWDEGRRTTNLSGLRLAVKDVGTLTGEARLNGPSREAIAAIDSLATLQEAGDAATLAAGTFTFKDESVVKRAIDGQASRAKVDPEKFRDQFARGLPFMLAFVGNRDFLAKATPVLQDFIRSPGTITVTAAPPQPVALSAVIAAARGQPFSLPTLLGLSLTGTPGPKPPAPPRPPAPAPAPGASP